MKNIFVVKKFGKEEYISSVYHGYATTEIGHAKHADSFDQAKRWCSKIFFEYLRRCKRKAFQENIQIMDVFNREPFEVEIVEVAFTPITITNKMSELWAAAKKKNLC